jgi:hypothetical protein
VYVLPSNDDIMPLADGGLTVKNAVYRCAGNRQVPAATVDAAPQVPSGLIRTLVDNQDVQGYKRSLAEATLGYVYALPGDGRVPVYALGENGPQDDNDCYFQRWDSTRVKRYVTSEDDRAALIKMGFRDDGIAFYVPAAASDATVQIDTSVDGLTRFYFPDGPEVAKRKDPQPAFVALAAATDGAVPLMRVFYSSNCGAAHDELVASKSRFDRVRLQGDKQPLYALHWSGLTASTILVVEALDAGCPYAGFLAPKSDPSYVGGAKQLYEAWVTPQEAQAASSTNELFINGQFDGNPKPRPIARSFITVAPAPAPDLDWSFGFRADDSLGTFVDEDCQALDGNCFQTFRQKSEVADIEFFFPESRRWALGTEFGELWSTYGDLGGDVNGKFRLTPLVKADLAADSYLYATMEADAFSTNRRYPQILISDQDPPVQANLPLGKTLVFQTFGDWPNRYEAQVCDHQLWDVNNQCPRFDFYHQTDPKDSTNKVVGLAPNYEVGERAGVDRSTRFEVYASTTHVYVYVDGAPFGCGTLPSTGVPSGAVTVTFGDVLYHSDADDLFDFHQRHQRYVTRRHYDNLGFKSHVALPAAWDESRLPCTARLIKPN